MITRLRALLQRKFVRDTLILQVSNVGVTGLTMLSSILVFRLLGSTQYATWVLVQSFLAIWVTFNVSGVGLATRTLLPMAIGKHDQQEILNLLAFYVRISVIWAVGLTTLMAVFAVPLADRLYEDGAHVGALAVLLSLTSLADALYQVVIISLQSQREMRRYAILQNANQAILVLTTLVALLTQPTPESLVIARLCYSLLTMLLALRVYQRFRRNAPDFPPLSAIFRHATQVKVGSYLRFGFGNAVDKNIANFFNEVPIQILAITFGSVEAGYLGLALRALSLPGQLTGALFDNLSAVIPQEIGRRNYARLWKSLLQIIATLIIGGGLFYLAFAVIVPYFIPLVYGEEAIPVVPFVTVLCIYGLITLVGGVFGPLYRAFFLLRQIIFVKIVALAVMVPLGFLLTTQLGAIGGAWMINGLFALSVGATIALVLPVLRERAHKVDEVAVS